MSDSESKASFFRQSGWMVSATVAGGAFMFLVHLVVTRFVSEEEYTEFFALLRVVTLLGIPSAGLLTIFARQTSGAVGEKLEAQLADAIRKVSIGIVCLWSVMLLFVAAFHGWIISELKVSSVALWLTLVLTLTTLLVPVARGVLQGSQHFLGFGWSVLLDGAGRLGAAAFIIFVISKTAAGVTFGAVLGQVASLVIAIWYMRDWLRKKTQPVDWKPWLRRAVPLTIGAGIAGFFITFDSVYARSLFSKEAYYLFVPGNLVGYALMQFTVPIAIVMFPKIVRSAATMQKTNALRLTLIATAVVGGLAAIASTLLPWLPVRVLFGPDKYVAGAPLVPWYAWCMLIFTLANVLINNLLARDQFKVVGWLVAIVTLYVGTLWYMKPSMLTMEPFEAYKRIVMVLSGCNVLLLLGALWFSRGQLGGIPAATQAAGDST